MSGYQESDRETDGMRLLDEARRAGLHVYQADDGRLVVEGPKRHDKLARALVKAKPDVVAALAQEPESSAGVCTRCRERVSYRVVAYWSPNERLCSTCCEWVAADFDARDAWPAPDWSDIREGLADR
jgi:hypothetical protein